MAAPGIGIGVGTGVAALAFMARLVPVLHGGGLRGYGNYDDGVYFAAGTGLAEGRLPYRDFLLLHPPGVAILLAPFGWLARSVGDPTAFAVGRVSFMVLGAASAVLVLAVLWRRGRFGAVIGSVGYAVFYPAVYGEHSTLLEAPQNLVLLAALAIIVRTRRRARTWPFLAAGFLLGLSPCIKIWGVLPVLVVVVWVGLGRGRRPLGRLLVGGVVAGLVVLGPFFAAAPGQMWNQVVLAQAGRMPTVAARDDRLNAMTGLDLFLGSRPSADPAPAGWTPLLIAVCVGWLIVLALAVLRRDAIVFAVLHLALVAFLLIEPTWFMHYAAFVAPTAALCLGSAVLTLSRWGRALPLLRLGLAGLALAGVLATASPLLRADTGLGRLYPSDRVAVELATDGCVTTDDPANLILSDVLGRNLGRHCRLVVDLQGYSNAQPVDGEQVPRPQNDAFQATALDYLGSGSRAVISRLGPRAFTDETIDVIRSWPVRARIGNLVVRAPAAR